MIVVVRGRSLVDWDRVAMVESKWIVPDGATREDFALSEGLLCSPLLARLLRRRGVDDPSEAETFLSPKLVHLHDPALLPNIDAATARVDTAIRERERVAIFGDYDVDGISSTALLAEFFRLIGFPVARRLPERLVDGYGLKPHSVEALAADGVDLVITVDNGVSAVAAVDRAIELGIDVVILDHHQPPPELPRAIAVVDPWLAGSQYPFPDLAGVGVTFKFVWAMCQRLSKQKKLSDSFREFLLDALAFVALGTVADVVPLLGENRTLASYGLRALRHTERPGLRFLVDLALSRGGDKGRPLVATDIGFRIGPLLNAAGRLGRAERGLDLLLAENEETARRLGEHLQEENERRRVIEREICDEARGLIDPSTLSSDRAIVLGGDGWHAGVIGIVAARITEEFFRPTLIVALDGERGRGSARSIPGVDIARALSRCDDCLLSHGGHELAAGVEMVSERVDDLRVRLNDAIDLDPCEYVRETATDGEVNLAELTLKTLEELARLEPFGEQNPEPLFVINGVDIVGRPKAIGRGGDHLALFVRQGDVSLRGIAFGQGERVEEVAAPGTRWSLLATPQISTWQGRRSVELLVRDLRAD